MRDALKGQALQVRPDPQACADPHRPESLSKSGGLLNDGPRSRMLGKPLVRFCEGLGRNSDQGRDHVAPPGNQAANGEHKHRPTVRGVPGLLETPEPRARTPNRDAPMDRVLPVRPDPAAPLTVLAAPLLTRLDSPEDFGLLAV